jgi:hypothetical protein
LPDSGPGPGVESVRPAGVARSDWLEGAGEGEGATAEASALLAEEGLVDWPVDGAGVPVGGVVTAVEAVDELAAELVIGGDAVELGFVAGGKVLAVGSGLGAGLTAAPPAEVGLVVGPQLTSVGLAGGGQRTADDAPVLTGCIPVSTRRCSYP